MLAAAASFVGVELTTPCPPGGPLAFGDCEDVRPFVTSVVALSAVLYVVGLSAIRWWTASLRSRRLADAAAARDWYLLGATLGLLAAPLLAFTLVSAVR